jgi:serine/threonine protein kinase
MPPATPAQLLDTMRSLHLLDAAQLGSAAQLQTKLGGTKELIRELVRRGWLTTYQVNELAQGRGSNLLLGSYVLLERIGEGGMGTVFKARNWKLGQIVALKVIRKDRLQNPKVIKRFYREVRATTQLSGHPNIVSAIDADQIGDRHVLVMEYVQGTDLAKLVKQNGPLPVEQAGAYIRQAACGLAHAYEKGLVHRDIKPHNLFLTAQGQPVEFVVKILDLGLARLESSEEEGSALTQEGSVVGTLDYLAPEQAQDPSGVDIRADLYSLGCTFYFLLTGKPPFPGGSPPEKLVKHRLEPPPPIQQLRPEVSPAIAAIVHKLLAKKPSDRYQTPAELIAALDAVLAPAPVPAGPKRRRWRRRLAVVGAVAVLLVCLSAFGKWGREKEGTNSSGTEKEITNSIGMKLVLLPQGKFTMGSPPTEEGFAAGEEAHEVEITKPFYLGVHPVTQQEYQRVMGANPSYFAATGPGNAAVTGLDTSRFPVENITFDDAVAFCQKLSALPGEKSKGRRYRLPTEAEWEYAARGGTTTPVYFGTALASTQANFNGASPYGGAPPGPSLGRPVPVGSYPPNPFGLRDMLGNVWQWTSDWYDPAYYAVSPRQDPTGPAVSPLESRAMRGGSYDAPGQNCRAACRGHGLPNDRWHNTGFRVAMVVGP